MIGVFDSGVGGLWVVSEIRQRLPTADIVYVADQGRAPYGPRARSEVLAFSDEIASWLMDRGAEPVVIACNTASAAALHELRARYPSTSFVGMEPAVKPAAAATHNGVIGVLATEVTFQGELFSSVVDRFAAGHTVLTRPCPRWVELVEAGDLEAPELKEAVAGCVVPLIESGVDTLVLACTHYPFLIPLIRETAGPGVAIIDPAPAIASQTARIADGDGAGTLEIHTSGDPSSLSEFIARNLAGIAGAKTFKW